MKRLLLLYSLSSVVGAAVTTAQAPDSLRGARPIQDNSFRVEEAYNQEGGVVQHINTFARTLGSRSWGYTFTQEWSVGGMRHQLSYTLPVMRMDETPVGRTGIGDAALNYRYQLIGSGEAPVAVAPRITAIIPTGSSQRGFGTGGAGIQLNLPLSIILSRSLIAHSNAGAIYTPRAYDARGDRATTHGYNLGQSLIWLVHPKLNLMLEGEWARTDEVTEPGEVERNNALLLSPGLRGAIDFASGLQIVPGIAFPIGVGPSRGERNVFFYLSLEHPFTKVAP